ncbi:flagellar biosynthesis protein FlgA [Solwaraspora sp. WMMD1047]|uniref:flagellar biosynthesis protein FlgA n=1 Tax=Solwaraspora sp. WMMD1047 TaxID=3016102 RepID=UPI0024164FFA|nr:flagellar biosynthesis protein FlgA [Solwaraspora sp. WMMD1047]MDG4833494.1 flagellar biosynthesis protein FlgA [Solwaraspora sp. WMMD1047]
MATEPALRPTRWPGPPRRTTVLRAGLVATFLALAAGALYAVPPATGCEPVASTPVDGRGAGGDGCGAGRSAGPASGPVSTDHPDPGPAAQAAGRPAADADDAADDPADADGQPGSELPGGLPLPAGAVGVPVPLAEPAVLAVVRPGTRVNLLAALPARRPGATVEPVLLAERVPVLAVLRPAATDGSAAVYLALDPEQARRTIGMPPDARFALAVLP